MQNDGKLVGETVVRGVELKLRELDGGNHRLSWAGADVEGTVDLDTPAAAGQAWAQSIADLREDPARDPQIAGTDEPAMAF